MARQSAEHEPEAERLDASLRTLAALEVLAARPQGVTPKELSRALGLHLSTCYRLLNTLVATGYSVRSSDSGLFQLAQRVAYLHHGYLRGLRPPTGSLPFIHALQLTTGETAMLNQLEGDDAICTAVVTGSRPGAQLPVYVGMAAPAHAIAAGKLLLAWLPAAQLDAYVARAASAADAPFPLTHPDALRAELEQIRLAGYAVDRGEGHPEVCCVAAPVSGQSGEVTASINLIVSCARLRQEEPALIAAVLAAARAISTLQADLPAADGERDADPQTPETATRAEIEAALAAVSEVMSRVG